LGHRAETQAAGLLADKQATNRYLRLAWLRMNENQTEGAREPGQRWPALPVRARLGSEKNQSDITDVFKILGIILTSITCCTFICGIFGLDISGTIEFGHEK